MGEFLELAHVRLPLGNQRTLWAGHRVGGFLAEPYRLRVLECGT